MYLKLDGCDWWTDITNNSVFDLEISQDHPEDDIILELKLRGEEEDYPLEKFNLRDNPELMAIYDFDNHIWVESELAHYWDGLTVWIQ